MTSSIYQDKHQLKQVSIDRLHLGLDSLAVSSDLQDLFKFPNSSKFYYKKLSSHGFTLYVEPKVRRIPKVKLILNLKFFKGNLSEVVKKVLSISQNWYIQAMDVAYDFNTKISNTYALTRANTKKNKRYNPNTYYFSENSDSRALVYDKKKQLKEKKRRTIADEHLTRYEIRMRLGKAKKRLVERDFSYIQPLMDKHKFITSYSKLPLTSKEKKIIRDSKDRKAENLVASNHTINKIRKIIREHSVPFFTIFDSKWRDLMGYISEAIENKEMSYQF